MGMNWSGKQVLVCGGAGLIGSFIARELLQRGAAVTIVDNLSSGVLDNIEDIRDDAEVLVADLRDPAICDAAARGKDVVFQLAANMGGIGYITSIGAEIMRDSAGININMLEAARSANVERYFYSSSACVYPEYRQTDEHVTALKEEDAYPAEPDQFYGWEKLFTEKLCEAYQKDYGMCIRVARFHNVFGPVYTGFDKAKGKAPCHLIMKAIQHPDSPFDIWGDGEQTRSFLYIDDCIKGVLRLVASDHGRPINIGSDRLVTINQLADIVIHISGKTIVPTHDLTKPQGVRGRNADLTRVRQVLGWEPEVTLEEGLRRTYEWTVARLDHVRQVCDL